MREFDPDLIRRMEAYGRETARALETVMERFQEQGGEKWGFSLFIFSFDGPEFTWISNAQRTDMIKALKATNCLAAPRATQREGRCEVSEPKTEEEG